MMLRLARLRLLAGDGDAAPHQGHDGAQGDAPDLLLLLLFTITINTVIHVHHTTLLISFDIP